MPSTQPTIRTLLDALATKARLFEVARHFGVAVPQKATKSELATALARSDQLRVRGLVEWMGRDELRSAFPQSEHLVIRHDGAERCAQFSTLPTSLLSQKTSHHPTQHLAGPSTNRACTP